MPDPEREPKVRHEFVGMMFAVTIGEVGLQVASLMQAKPFFHFLPFYSHLFLATIVITSSWVGWTLSQAPGARRDVTGVFTWGFITLLLDVFLVVTYFILVRTIELGKGKEPDRIDPPDTVALLILVMFSLYLLWDLITKIFAYEKARDGEWIRNCGLRMVPTLVCLVIAIIIRNQLKNVDLVHYIDADAALLALALLFRGLKDGISAGLPRSGEAPDRTKVRRAMTWSLICLMVIIVGTTSAKYSWHLLPMRFVAEIQGPANNEGVRTELRRTLPEGVKITPNNEPKDRADSPSR
jgi:hypothetical protein